MDQRKKLITRLDDRLLNMVKVISSERGITQNQFIENLIKREISQWELKRR